LARLHEYQGKALLRQQNILLPQGRAARTPREARDVAAEIGKPVMVKAQVWVTGRASMGGIRKVATPDEAASAAAAMLGMKVKGFTVEQVLVEEQLEIAREFYAGDCRRPATGPLVIFSVGGTALKIAATYPDKVARACGHRVGRRSNRRATGAQDCIGGKLQGDLSGLLVSFCTTSLVRMRPRCRDQLSGADG
jgi:succinyl-CoA synthetase beta subunit